MYAATDAEQQIRRCMSKIKRLFEKTTHENVTENLTKEQIKYREIDETIESQRMARNERASYVPLVWLSQEEIEKIDDRVRKEREIYGVYSKQNNSDITKAKIAGFIKKIKSDIEKENESSLTCSIMAQVQDMLGNYVRVVGDNPPIEKAQHLIKKYFLNIVLSALDIDIEKCESEDELIVSSDIHDAHESLVSASLSANEDTDLLVDIEELGNNLVNGRKRAAISSAVENPLYSLVGLLKWPFWRLSESGRSYAKHKKAEKRFSNYKY